MDSFSIQNLQQVKYIFNRKDLPKSIYFEQTIQVGVQQNECLIRIIAYYDLYTMQNMYILNHIKDRFKTKPEFRPATAMNYGLLLIGDSVQITAILANHH